MNRLELNDNWKVRKAGSTEDYITVSIPNSVYGAYLQAGRMEDPYYRDNELAALKLMDEEYEFVKTITADDSFKNYDRVILRFDGVDTLADIILNGELLGKCDNMHRIWEYDVKHMLVEGVNELRVLFHSPTDYIAESYAHKPISGIADCMKGYARLRKAHYMFGWDWGARLPDAGLFRGVSLLCIEKQRIDNVLITQTHCDGKVTLGFKVEIEDGIAADNYAITVKNPDGTYIRYDNSPISVEVQNPRLWWPHGYGEQPLYEIMVELIVDGKVVDVTNKRIGLRTMRLCREKDEYGESFAHEVNGVKIFAMGADYIPEDNLLGRISKERTRALLTDAIAANHNTIRVWGGGYYPEDDFYDICDELGLLVWQDFMFACCVYDLTEEFEESITAEFIDNIKRLRHHASLGLWCGNNEMESFIYWHRDEWCYDPKEYSDYINMYEYIIPKLVKKYDPQAEYWPSSPSSGGAFDAPADENRGDVHYWDVWHGNKPFTEYRKFFFRYLSEFGFQAFPSLKTVESFTLPEDRNVFSYIMEKHQRNYDANGKIINYLQQTFLYPTDFDMVLYASQLLSAEAIKYGVEHFRRNRGRCMGAVVWQLNDCWPVASWSSIDYFGRWKALHYYEKRFFAPLAISCKEEGMLSQNPNINAQPYDIKKSIELCVENETMTPRTVKVMWELRDANAKIKRSAEELVTVQALSSQWIFKVEFPEAELFSDYVSYRMLEEDEIISEGTVLFCQPKYFRFVKPQINVRIEGDELVVSADVFARSIRILNANDDMLLSDNYFDLNGDEKRVKILRGRPEGLSIRSVYDIR